MENYLRNRKRFFKKRNFFNNNTLSCFIDKNKFSSIHNYIGLYFFKYSAFNKGQHTSLPGAHYFNYNNMPNLAKEVFMKIAFLNRLYKNFFYSCLFRKDLNNLYITVVNRFGEVAFNYSAGRLGTIKKKQKKAKNVIFLMIPNICYKLKNLKIYKLRFYINSEILSMYKAIINEFLKRGVHSSEIVFLNSIPHNNGNNIKYKKLRRI